MDKVANIYGSRCPYCTGSRPPVNAAGGGNFDSIIEDLARQLYNQQQNGGIPEALYQATADRLLQGMFSGLGDTSFSYNDGRNSLAAYLRHNLYTFSAAKSLTELRQLNALLTDANGNTRSWTDFRNSAYDAGFRFNKTWMQTEYDNAIAGAEMARKWEDLTADHEYLQYTTVGDDRVRPAHAALDKLTLHKSSQAWARIWPPNDWACRCSVIPGAASKIKYSDAEAVQMGREAVKNPLFNMNTGTDRVIFSKDHPYFEQAGQKRPFEAQRNYGMPSVYKIYADNDWPEAAMLESKDQFKEWLNTLPKPAGSSDPVIRDRTGTQILFDNSITRSARVGQPYNFVDILQHPDEVWSQRTGSNLTIYYLRYYESGPHVVAASSDGGILKAEAMFPVTRPIDIRKGALIYKK